MNIVLLLLAFWYPGIVLGQSLIGGTETDKALFPELVYIAVPGGKCSATAIGPRTLLTAGHCVIGDGSATFQIAGQQFHAACEASPQFKTSHADTDAALCYTDAEMPIVTASVSAQPLASGDEVLLTGYGCIEPGGGDGNDGILRTGKINVGYVPLGGPGDTWFEAQGTVAACFGDSGSGILTDGHVLRGIVSRGNIRDLSLLTAIWLPDAQAFLKDWAGRHKTFFLTAKSGL